MHPDPSKRILLATSDVPFVEGGHRVIARCLRDALQAEGCECEIWPTPQNRFGRQMRAYVATRLTDLEMAGDQRPVDGLVSLKYPSYAARHPRHICWLVHRMREYYDLWESFRASLSWRGKIKEAARRRLIHAMDRRLLTRNVSRVFTISANVRDQLQRWGGIPGEVLYPPPPPRPYRTERYGDFLLSYSRLDRLKRMDLVLRAFARASTGMRLVIGGEGSEARRLAELAGELGIAPRVTFSGRLSSEALVEALASCRAVVFAPLNEDLGFVTLEAFRARKPVITTDDAGGPLEFVRDGETGLVAAPEPDAVAAAMERLGGAPEPAAGMGARAFESIADLQWDRTARTLVSALGF